MTLDCGTTFEKPAQFQRLLQLHNSAGMDSGDKRSNEAPENKNSLGTFDVCCAPRSHCYAAGKLKLTDTLILRETLLLLLLKVVIN